MKFIDLSTSSPTLPSMLKDADADTVYLRAGDGRTYTLVAVREEPVRAYVEETSRPLVRTLEHAAGLPAVRLAGYAANIDFWLAEARHWLDVAKEYPARFDAFRAAQVRFAQEKGWREPPEVTPSTTATERKEARRAVVSAMTRLADRCLKEGLIDAAERQEVVRALG